MIKLNKNNNHGMAMVGVLLFFVVLIGLSAVFILRSVNEANRARIERQEAIAFYAAQGAEETALNQLNTLINDYLLNTISSSTPSGVVSFANSKVGSGDGIGWLTYAVRNNNVAVLTQNGDQAEYTQSSTMGGANYTYNIIITEKSDPVTAGTSAWDFPYSYRIESAATLGSANKKVNLSGDFTVRVQKDNFAKFALFTNTQNMEDGTRVWFTNSSVFNGPVHTNDRFNFAKNPSGTFYENIAQAQQTARFYNNNTPVLLDANANGAIDVPTFYGSFTRGASAITLSSPTTQADVANQAKGGQNFGSNGIYVPNSSGALTGGIYVKGDSSVSFAVSGGKPVYTITQGGTTKQVTVNYASNQTTVQTVGGSNTTYSGIPNGIDHAGTIIHVDGNVTSFSGTVQSDTEVTLSVRDNVTITNNVRYQTYTPSSGTPGQPDYVPPNADGATNLLGLVSWTGDVRVGTSAPNNIDIHGSVLAQNGVFEVTNYNDAGVGPRGTATLLGGSITDNYGPFFQFNGATGQLISGYSRNFVYDDRMQVGNAPPYFPSLNTFIAFTNDLTDKLIWQGEK
jgi:hypothetical protein